MENKSFADLLQIKESDQPEPEFTCKWMIVAVSEHQRVMHLTSDGGFTVFEFIQSDDDTEACLELPPNHEEFFDEPGVYIIENMRCVDNGVCHTQDGIEYDTPVFAGEWRKLYNLADAIPK